MRLDVLVLGLSRCLSRISALICLYLSSNISHQTIVIVYVLCFRFLLASPLFCSLTQAAPCPAPWVVNTVYSEGDQVTSYDHLSVQNQIYVCNPWPNSDYCGQAGFQPGQNEIGTATPAWTMAWTLVGPCSESPVSDM